MTQKTLYYHICIYLLSDIEFHKWVWQRIKTMIDWLHHILEGCSLVFILRLKQEINTVNEVGSVVA